MKTPRTRLTTPIDRLQRAAASGAQPRARQRANYGRRDRSRRREEMAFAQIVTQRAALRRNLQQLLSGSDSDMHEE